MSVVTTRSNEYPFNDIEKEEEERKGEYYPFWVQESRDNTTQHFCHWKLNICEKIYQIHSSCSEIATSNLCERRIGLEVSERNKCWLVSKVPIRMRRTESVEM